MKRRALPLALVLVAALTGACGDSGDGSSSGSGSGSGSVSGGDRPAATAAKAPSTPQETLRQFAAAVADNDAAGACALMLEGTRVVFAQQEETADCAAAVAVLSSKVADAAAYKAMVPSGLEVDGDSAEVSGYCGEGWRTAAGGRFEGDGEDPNDLGTLVLRKTAQGWLITEYTSDESYSSCGG